MKVIDRLGQQVRIRKALPYIRAGSRVLDVGCADGALFRILGNRLSYGVGIDPDAVPTADVRRRIVRGRFPEDLDESGPFDAITALAVLEHVPRDQQPAFAAACRRLMGPGGRLILTVPEPAVDHIVHLLAMTPFAEGIACHEHYGFVPQETLPLFQRAGLWVEAVRRFELGLNNLFVFTRPS